MKSKFKKIAIGIVGFLVIVLAVMKLISLRTYNKDNPRSLPNGYLMTHSVHIDRSPKEVFDFITYQMADYNLSLAEAHDKFEILNGDGLTEGAIFISEEYQETEGVRNRYLVKEVVPEKMIFYTSTPSLIYELEDDEWKQTGSCNTYVYFDMEEQNGGTKLSQTLVLEMHNFFTKFMIDMIIWGEEENEWYDHLVEELESLKVAIESNTPKL